MTLENPHNSMKTYKNPYNFHPNIPSDWLKYIDLNKNILNVASKHFDHVHNR